MRKWMLIVSLTTLLAGCAPRDSAEQAAVHETSHAHSQQSAVHVMDAIIPAPPPGTMTAAGYLVIENTSAQDIRLSSAETAAASSVSLHETSTEDGTARMRPLSEGLLIPAGQHVSLEAGHSHLMLEGLKRSLAPGDQVPVTLVFTSGHTVEATFAVQSYAQIEHGRQNGHH